MCSKFGSLVLAVALTGAMLSFCGSASAVTITTYTYDLNLPELGGGSDYVDLILTTDQMPGLLAGEPGSGALITNISGKAYIDSTTYTASGPDSTSFPGADNLLYSDSPFVNSSGIGFDLTPDPAPDTPYLWAAAGLSCYGGTNGCATFDVYETKILFKLVPSATPLPAALPLFATGLGAMGLFGWRKKRKALAAA